MKKINIGLIGLGTIGRGVLRVLSQKRKFFKKRFGVDFHIAKVCDKNPKLRKKLKVSPNVHKQSKREMELNLDQDKCEEKCNNRVLRWIN